MRVEENVKQLPDQEQAQVSTAYKTTQATESQSAVNQPIQTGQIDTEEPTSIIDETAEPSTHASIQKEQTHLQNVLNTPTKTGVKFLHIEFDNCYLKLTHLIG